MWYRVTAGVVILAVIGNSAIGSFCILFNHTAQFWFHRYHLYQQTLQKHIAMSLICLCTCHSVIMANTELSRYLAVCPNQLNVVVLQYHDPAMCTCQNTFTITEGWPNK